MPGDDARIRQILADLRTEMPAHDPERAVRTLAERMVDLGTPGVSAAIIDRFDVAWTGGFGARKADTPDDVRPDTPFQAGSISKPIFALVVVRLCKDGRLDLDADIGTYLRSWRLPKAANGWTPGVTLRQLLSHTAGTSVHGFPGYPADMPPPSLPMILDGLPPTNTSPVFVDLIPGTQFRYSGGGTTLAELAVCDALGMSLVELARSLVFEPLGMADSSYEQPPSPAFAARAAIGHPVNRRPVPGGWHVYPERAAGGLWTTAADLARLGAAVIRTLRGEPTALGLTGDSLAAMLRPPLPDQAPGSDYWGLGWYCAGAGERFRFGHAGENHGFYAEWLLYPATGQGAAVLINSNQGWRLPKEMLKAIGRAYDWPDAAPTPASPVPDLAPLVGAYRDADGTLFRIEQRHDGLVLRVNGQEPIPLIPSGDQSFVARMPPLEVRFTTDAGGTRTMTLTQGGKTFVATREAD